MIKLNEFVFAETSYIGCNIGWILTREGIVLIDTPALPPDIADLKRKINIDDIVYTLYTHEHFDHILGGCEVGLHSIGHINVVPEIQRLRSELPYDVNRFFPALYQQYKKYVDNLELRSPRITFQDSLQFTLGNTEIEMFHVGGHSAASCFVYLPHDKMLFCGDTVNHGMPYVTPMSNFREWITLLQHIERMEIVQIIPGHGNLCGKNEARKIRVYFENLELRVKECIRQGMTKLDMIQNLELGEWIPTTVDNSSKMQVAFHAGMMYEEIVPRE